MQPLSSSGLAGVPSNKPNMGMAGGPMRGTLPMGGMPNASIGGGMPNTSMGGGMPNTSMGGGMPNTSMGGGMPNTSMGGGLPNTSMGGGMPNTSLGGGMAMGGMPNAPIGSGMPNASMSQANVRIMCVCSSAARLYLYFFCLVKYIMIIAFTITFDRWEVDRHLCFP